MRLSIMKIMVLYLKHKCGKEIVAIAPSLFFSHFFIFSFLAIYYYYYYLVGFFGLFLFMGFFGLFYFYKVRILIPTCGGIIVFIILSSLGQCSNNEDHHTFMDLQLKARTIYDSI